MLLGDKNSQTEILGRHLKVVRTGIVRCKRWRQQEEIVKKLLCTEHMKIEEQNEKDLGDALHLTILSRTSIAACPVHALVRL